MTARVRIVADVRPIVGGMADSLARVPNKPKTPQTPFRIPPELKAAAMSKARAEGKTLTDVVIAALTRYVRTPPKEKP